MKRFILISGLIAGVAIGVQAQQVPQSVPQNAPQVDPQDVPQSVPQNRDTRDLRFPYLNSGTYNSVDANQIPENIRTSFQSEYSTAQNPQWESNNDVYRSSFDREGKRWSVLYGVDGRVIQTETQASLQDLPASAQEQFRNRNISTLNQIKVGDRTYYSTQMDGKDSYFDSEGKALEIPRPGGR